MDSLSVSNKNDDIINSSHEASLDCEIESFPLKSPSVKNDRINENNIRASHEKYSKRPVASIRSSYRAKKAAEMQLIKNKNSNSSDDDFILLDERKIDPSEIPDVVFDDNKKEEDSSEAEPLNGGSWNAQRKKSKEIAKTTIKEPTEVVMPDLSSKPKKQRPKSGGNPRHNMKLKVKENTDNIGNVIMPTAPPKQNKKPDDVIAAQTEVPQEHKNEKNEIKEKEIKIEKKEMPPKDENPTSKFTVVDAKHEYAGMHPITIPLSLVIEKTFLINYETVDSLLGKKRYVRMFDGQNQLYSIKKRGSLADNELIYIYEGSDAHMSGINRAGTIITANKITDFSLRCGQETGPELLMMRLKSGRAKFRSHHFVFVHGFELGVVQLVADPNTGGSFEFYLYSDAALANKPIWIRYTRLSSTAAEIGAVKLIDPLRLMGLCSVIFLTL